MVKQHARRRTGRTALQAAELVLMEMGKPLHCRELVQVMLSKGLWTTKGRTPAATLYVALRRDMNGKGSDSRLRHAGKGLFSLAK